MFVIAFLTCCKNREGDDSAVYEQREFLLTNIFKDTLKRYVVLTPQFADSLLDAAVGTKNRDAICVAINAVIDSRDSASTEKAILAAMKKYYTYLLDSSDFRDMVMTVFRSNIVNDSISIYIREVNVNIWHCLSRWI